MTKLSYRVLIFLVTLYLVSSHDLETQYKLKNNIKLRQTYNKLLEAVTSVNQERLESLKKFYDLQNYLPKVGRTEDRAIVAVIIPNANKLDSDSDVNDSDDLYERTDNALRDKAGSTILKNDENIADAEEIIDSEDSANIYLRKKWKGCNKSAARTCKKACKKAFKDTCSDYKCSRSMKRSGRRACKRICNAKFGYSSSYNSDSD